MRGMATLLRGRSVHDPENAIEDDDRTSRYKIRDGIVAQKSDEEPWQNISGQQHRKQSERHTRREEKILPHGKVTQTNELTCK